MNKLLTKIAAATLGVAMAIGVGIAVNHKSDAKVAKAAEVVYKQAIWGDGHTDPYNANYTGTSSTTNNGFTLNSSCVNTGNATDKWTEVRLGRKNTASVATFTTAAVIDKSITKVVINFTSFGATSSSNKYKLLVASDSDFTKDLQTIDLVTGTGEKTTSVTTPAANRYYCISFDTDNSYSSANGYIRLNRIDFVYNESGYSVTTTVEHGTSTGATHIDEDPVTVTIAPSTGYKLPSSVVVTNASSEYDPSTGIVTLSNPTGAVTVSASCPAATSYNITVTATNCTYTPASPTIYENGEATITFTANSGYDLPESNPTVVNSSVKSWNNGVLVLKNATGAVSVTVTASVHVAKKYGLYTGAITAGKYVIVGNGTSNALKNTTSNSRFTNQTVTISNGIISDPAESVIWEFAQVENTSYWSIYNVAVKKYAGAAGSGSGSLSDTIASNFFHWDISYNDGYSSFINVGRGNAESSPANKYLRNNGNYGWASYASSTGVVPTLYKLDHLPKVFSEFDYVDATPDKTTYIEGESFDPAGLTIKAVYTEPSIYPSEDITDQIAWDALEEGTQATGKWQGHDVVITGLTISAFQPVEYTKVTSLDQLAIGSQVILGGYKKSDSQWYTLTTFSSSFFTAATTTVDNDKMKTVVNSVVWTIEADSNGYYLRNGTNYLNRSNSDNSFGPKDTSSDKLSCWTFTFTDGQFAMKQGTQNFQFNEGSPRFKCYTSTQGPLSIFIKETAIETNVLKTYVSRYLNPTNGSLDDIPSGETHQEGTDCIDNNYYVNAKTALVTGEFSSKNSAFQNSTDTIVKNARLRYAAWARAAGDTTPYALGPNNEIIVSGSNIVANTSKSNSAVIIIVVSAATSMILLGGLLVLRKRKEQ